MKNGVYVNGRWRGGNGPELVARDPSTGVTVWQGASAAPSDVADAVQSARAAFDGWSEFPSDVRFSVLRGYADALESARPGLIEAIGLDVGKPRWEADAEVSSMVRKVEISMAAYHERTGERTTTQGQSRQVLRHRPHGVLAVLGPFNFPGHLPNGHIVPALLAGNTVVFKPSEQTPLTAERMTDCFEEAGLPAGVLNVVQGGRATGEALAQSAGIDGLLFTGSAEVGMALHRQFAGTPQKILALEMGGNNPIVAWETGDLDAAAATLVASAFMTAGQRCTCARRLIVQNNGDGDALVQKTMALAGRLIVGAPNDVPEPFMGPLISNDAVTRILAAEANWYAAGAVPLLPLQRLGDTADFARNLPFLTPGMVDVTIVAKEKRLAFDEHECFGPLLQVVRVSTFEEAVAEANQTRFGLSAGLLSDEPALWQRFVLRIRAGLVNWNRPSTGAASDSPFGGVGKSGNHRPSAYYAADYAAYPVASSEGATVQTPVLRGLR
jgi:succinylglutamic semialdehyde dehydrogenase